MGNYFSILDGIFSGSLGPASFFFSNKYYAMVKSKILKEVDIEPLLDYFFAYNDGTMFYTSDFLTYFLLSRLSYSLDSGVHLTKKEVKTEADLDDHIGRVDRFNRFLLEFVNLLLAMDVVYPNRSRDLYNGYKENFEHIKKHLVLSFLMRLDVQTLKKISDKLRIKRSKKGVKMRVRKVINFFWGRAPALIPKTKGLAEEIFVYYYLNNRRSGYYVIPMLLSQRFYSYLDGFRNSLKELKKKISLVKKEDRRRILAIIRNFVQDFKEYNYSTRPPDFLVLSKGRIFGLECGRGKEEHIASFSAITGIPTLFIDVLIHLGASSRHGFGLKCDKCYHPFLLCDRYIEQEIKGDRRLGDLDAHERYCIRLCDVQKAKKCEYSVIRLTAKKAMEYGLVKQNAKGSFFYHFNCLTKEIQENLRVEKLTTPIPFVENIDKLEVGL